VIRYGIPTVLFVFAGIGLWAVLAGGPTGPGDGARADGDAAAPVAATPGAPFQPGGHPLGLTAGVGAVPHWMVEGLGPELWRDRLAGDVDRLDGVEARWYRHHSSHHPGFDQRSLQDDGFGFADQDALVKGVQATGAELLVVIGRTNGIASCRQMTRLLPAQYLPAAGDEEHAYRDYVHAVVERYDGDGVDDMPGLAAPVRWYQLGNENDLHFRSCAERDRDYATPEQYLKLARWTRQAMAAASDEARLVAGMTFGHVTETETGWTQALVALDDGAILSQVDAVSLHDYSRDPAIQQQQIKALAALVDRRVPIWITETSVPGDPEAAAGWDAERQARAMVELVLGALASGAVERVFWHSLRDGPPVLGNRQWRNFGTNSLYACAQPVIPVRGPPRCGHFEPKPAARTFILLSDVLEGWTRVEALPDGTGWRIERGDKPAVRVEWKSKVDPADGVPLQRVDEE